MGAEKVICDTDVMIDYLDEESSRHVDTKTILEKNIGLDNVVLSLITRMELMQGVKNKAEEKMVLKKINRFNTALINNEISKMALDIFESYRLSHGIKIPDCLIAATVKITSLELFTYNTVDFKFINQLKLYKKR